MRDITVPVGDVQHVCDLAVLQSLDIAKDQRDPEVVRERREREIEYLPANDGVFDACGLRSEDVLR